MEGSRTSSFWRDLRHILERFEEVHAEDAGLRFVDALEETIDLIERFPDLGSPWESAKPRRTAFRFQMVKGFENYVVVYRRGVERVTFMRISHGSRNIEDSLG